MKQVIEIEVPKGKKAVYKNGTIIFEDIDILDSLTTLSSIIKYLEDNDLGKDILHSLDVLDCDSYEYSIALLRAIVCACTDAEKLHLIKGEIWYPYVQFCNPGKERYCLGNEVIGSIESEGKIYTVVCGGASASTVAGLGTFDSYYAVAHSHTAIGFRSVSSKRVAEHISKYFGKQVFDVVYGGCNCDWKWIE